MTHKACFAASCGALIGLVAGSALAQVGPDERPTPAPILVDQNATCNTTSVIQACALMPGAGATVGGAGKDAVQSLLITNPASIKPGDTFASGPFVVRFDAASQQTFSFTDLSLDGFQNVSQQAGTRGLEAVIVTGRSDNRANVYCEINWLNNKLVEPLTTPSGNINKIEFCWSRGPCLVDQGDVDSICSILEDTTTIMSDVLQTIEDSDDGPFNACGCFKDLRFCDPNHTDPSSPLSCDSGALTSLESQAIATGESGGANLTFCSGGACTKLR